MMKSASSALLAHLNGGGPFIVADLYTFTLGDGTVLRWTSRDVDISWNGNTYLSTGPIAKRGTIRQVAGPEVQTLDLTLGCGDSCTLPSGKKLTVAAAEGTLDGAAFRLDRLYLDAGGAGIGSIDNFFVGNVAQVEPGSTQVKLTIKSGLEKLSLPMPRRLFQPACPHELYGPACAVTKSPVSAPVITGSTASSVLVDVDSATDTLKLGTIKFTSGPCAGLSRLITGSTRNSASSHTLTLAVPLPYVPSAGDSASLLLGCDKTLSLCSSRFNNANRFGGMPWTPKPESVR